MMFIKVPQGISHAIATPMHRANTPNTLPLVTMGWTPVIVIIILHQALRALKSLIDKEQGDSMCTSMSKRINIPRGMFIVPISRGFLPCPNMY
jgi:hypothetical protein